MATTATNKAAAAKGAATTGSKTTTAKTTTVSAGKVSTPVAAKPATSSGSSTNNAVLSGLQGLTTSLSALGGLVGQLGSAQSATNANQAYIDSLAAQQANQAYASQQQAALLAAEKQAQGQSAYDTLYNEFAQYGLGSLVEPLKQMISTGATGSTLTLALQNTDAYKQRFAANQDRIKAGLSALSPAQYIALEDQYQNVMRNYGLPSSYWSKDSIGTQAGFNQLISGDVSSAELESRLIEAQQKVNNANPEVAQALKQFYPDITKGDILAYSLDPKNALNDIKRKVAAAEIGGSALAQGLGTSATSAEQLASAGITKAQAQQGYQQIAGYLPTATALSDIYAGQGLGAYGQSAAEADVFGTTGSAEAARKRKKLSQLEQAQFAAQSGTAQSGALSRDRALTNYMLGTPGAGAF